jgi:hypothetical protein
MNWWTCPSCTWVWKVLFGDSHKGNDPLKTFMCRHSRSTHAWRPELLRHVPRDLHPMLMLQGIKILIADIWKNRPWIWSARPDTYSERLWRRSSCTDRRPLPTSPEQGGTRRCNPWPCLFP